MIELIIFYLGFLLRSLRSFLRLPKPEYNDIGANIIFVLGGPGAGKGTQCTQLAHEYQVQHLSVGDVLRTERDTPGSKYGKLVAQNMEAGRIGPMEVTVKLLGGAIKKNLSQNKAQVFLIDGFPRKLDQLHLFEKLVGPAVFAMYLTCPENVRSSRLLERAKSEGRLDDTPEIIQKRFTTFNSTCMPVIDYLGSERKLFRIDAKADEKKVYADFERVIGMQLGHMLLKR